MEGEIIFFAMIRSSWYVFVFVLSFFVLHSGGVELLFVPNEVEGPGEACFPRKI